MSIIIHSKSSMWSLVQTRWRKSILQNYKYITIQSLMRDAYNIKISSVYGTDIARSREHSWISVVDRSTISWVQ